MWCPGWARHEERAEEAEIRQEGEEDIQENQGIIQAFQ